MCKALALEIQADPSVQTKYIRGKDPIMLNIEHLDNSVISADLRLVNHCNPISSTSNINVEFGGTRFGTPAAPYANSGGILS